MPTKEAIDFLIRLVSEKHKALVDSTRALLKILVGEGVPEKKQAVKVANRAARDLVTVVPANDLPSWLTSFVTAGERFTADVIGAGGYLEIVLPIQQAMESHKWSFDKDDQIALDFDAIFETCKKQSRLPELLESIIRILGEMHASDEIDSNAMLAALEKVINTLKQCKNGSYFSLNCAWSFLISFLNNYMWGALAAVPGLGTAMAALDKTIRETEVEMNKVHVEVTNALREGVEKQVKSLAGKSSFEFASYDRAGRFCPPKAAPQLPPSVG